MKRFVTILLSLFVYFNSYSQDTTYDISHWKAKSLPTDKDTLLKYNWANIRWYLHKEGKKVYAKSYEGYSLERKLPFEFKALTRIEEFEFGGEISYIKADSGYLVSFYQGEFGGSLYWFDKTGKTRIKIGYAMIIDFITYNNKIYALDGLGHMGMSYGNIIELRKENGEWKQIPYVKLPEAPRAFTLDEQNRFIVATSNKILLIDSNKRIDTLLENSSWTLLNPSSVVVVGNHLYVGMQHGVHTYDFKRQREKWLTKD